MRLSDVLYNEFVKNKSTLKTKVNKIDKNILDTATLIHINQYSTDKQSSEKKS